MNSSRRFIAPVDRESTASIIAHKLREAIAHGEIAPGSQLGEAELARELGVSRGPLREGMQRLTQEGLLVYIRNRGLFVIEMTPENVNDMYLARAAVERAAAAEIFVQGPDAAGQQLLKVIAKMAKAAERDKAASVGDADIEFHQLLVSLARSERLIRMHRTLLTETRMCIHALERTYADASTRVAEHREIAEAFTDGDPALADRLLREHMADAIERLSRDRVQRDLHAGPSASVES